MDAQSYSFLKRTVTLALDHHAHLMKEKYADEHGQLWDMWLCLDVNGERCGWFTTQKPQTEWHEHKAERVVMALGGSG